MGVVEWIDRSHVGVLGILHHVDAVLGTHHANFLELIQQSPCTRLLCHHQCSRNDWRVGRDDPISAVDEHVGDASQPVTFARVRELMNFLKHQFE